MSTAPFKRICIFADGTWANPETPQPTNIFHMATAISHFDKQDTPQLVFYDAGVGVTENLGDRVLGGAFGAGIDSNIQELYTLLAMNYSPGDEVYMFGYSRGSYTVRSLAGLINKSGLVRRDELDWVKEAYDLYRNRDVGSEDTDAKEFRNLHGDRIPIKCLACYDTVGTLGVPQTYSFPFNLLSNADNYRFHDTTLAESIEHAIHVLSIDETRETFRPTIMEPHPNRGPEQLTQKYFPGTHGGVGGGNQDEAPLAANALRFMVGELKRRMLALSFDEAMLSAAGPAHVNVPPVAEGGIIYRILTLPGIYIREIPSLDDIHESAFERYKTVLEWRPRALEKFRELILGDRD